jgi:tetratricopeptide (TPR) repeat protein
MLVSLHCWALSTVHFDSGDLKSARSCIEEALKLAHDNNEKHIERPSRIFLGRILGKAERSQFSEAEVSILQGISMLDELKLKPLSSFGHLYLGELYADTGQIEKGLANLKKAEGMFQCGVTVNTRFGLSLTDICTGNSMSTVVDLGNSD